MRFICDTTKSSCNGKVIYNIIEKSFDFIPYRNTDIIMLIGYIQLGFDSETFEFQQLWGLSPYEKWDEGNVRVPEATQGKLYFSDDLLPGMTYRVVEADNWKNIYDTSVGWFYYGNGKIGKNCYNIVIGDNVIATIDEGLLCAIYIKLDLHDGKNFSIEKSKLGY